MRDMPDECPFTEEQMRQAILFFPCGIDLVSVEHWFRDHKDVAIWMMENYFNTRAPQALAEATPDHFRDITKMVN